MFNDAASTVTPTVAAIVTLPTPLCSIAICVPNGNATDEFKGTVTVFKVAAFIAIPLFASPITNV